MPIFRDKSVKIYTGKKKFTRAPPVAPVTNMRYDDHPDGPASCKWSSGSIIFFSSFLFYSSANLLLSSTKPHLLLQNISSSFSNLRTKVQSRGPFKNNVFLFFYPSANLHRFLLFSTHESFRSNRPLFSGVSFTSILTVTSQYGT